MEGLFEGSYYPSEDGMVHAECYNAYRLSKAPVCFLCGEAIIADGHFCGQYHDVKGRGKLHTECQVRKHLLPTTTFFK